MVQTKNKSDLVNFAFLIFLIPGNSEWSSTFGLLHILFIIIVLCGSNHLLSN